MTKKRRPSGHKPGDLCLVQQKAFTGKHKIGDHWENTKYVVVGWQCNLPVYTIKLWQGDGQTHVVHRNLLMHIAPPHQKERVQSGSEESNCNTLPGDDELYKQTLSTTGPVMWSQTKAHQLAQSIQDTWTKVVQYVQWK